MSKQYSPDELRAAYLQFFADRDHAIVPSASLVPENDPTTLFTGSGMQPMVPYLLGEAHPQGKRIADSQKSFRSQDIEEVGDTSHTTFFEMLGNWSLGDYFKQEQVSWFFEFLVDTIGLPAERLFVSVYAGSKKLSIGQGKEAIALWQELFAARGITAKVVDNPLVDGLGDGRIFCYGDDNWWSRAGAPALMPAGEPGGPDSEVFYDFGPELGLHERSAFADKPCHVNCDCGRFLEIGNNVFMQYQKQADGSFSELPQKNVDFGGGFERILAALNNDPDVFKTALFTPIMRELEELSGLQYGESPEVTRSYRVIADHVRAAVMLAGDGVYPDNKEQGYFARRLVRRSVRYGKMIGITEPFMARLAPVVARIYEQAYPAVTKQLATISNILHTEELKFEKTLEKGLRELHKLQSETDTVISGEQAFSLYETYGFPLELTQEIAAESGRVVDENGFAQAKQAHAEASRSASAGKFKGGLADTAKRTTEYHTATHLLHAALRQVLGDTVEQQGSNITAKRLRFDFSHTAALTDQQVAAVEEQINDWIAADLPVHKHAMSKDAALAAGALAFFREKYPETVSVYTIGMLGNEADWVSKELCGGPHVARTSEIPKLELFKQKAIGSGLRRVYLRATPA